jgi:hypothetical protein
MAEHPSLRFNPDTDDFPDKTIKLNDGVHEVGFCVFGHDVVPCFDCSIVSHKITRSQFQQTKHTDNMTTTHANQRFQCF